MKDSSSKPACVYVTGSFCPLPEVNNLFSVAFRATKISSRSTSKQWSGVFPIQGCKYQVLLHASMHASSFSRNKMGKAIHDVHFLNGHSKIK